jgi:hypothetical protein
MFISSFMNNHQLHSGNKYYQNPQLYMEIGNSSNLMYIFNRQWYDAIHIIPIENPNNEGKLHFIDMIDPMDFRSQPVFVYLQNGLFDIFQTYNGRLYHYFGDIVLNEDLLDTSIEVITPFKVPGRNLPEFDPKFFERLAIITHERSSIRNLDLN